MHIIPKYHLLWCIKVQKLTFVIKKQNVTFDLLETTNGVNVLLNYLSSKGQINDRFFSTSLKLLHSSIHQNIKLNRFIPMQPSLIIFLAKPCAAIELEIFDKFFDQVNSSSQEFFLGQYREGGVVFLVVQLDDVIDTDGGVSIAHIETTTCNYIPVFYSKCNLVIKCNLVSKCNLVIKM